MTIPPENTPTTDATAVTTGPATASSDLGADFVCDIDGNRLNVIGRHVVGDTKYEIRECSANPDHVKHQPI